MPISEKIIQQINLCKATKPEKELMLKVLEVEDKGSFRYQADYEALIKEYLDEHQEVSD